MYDFWIMFEKTSLGIKSVNCQFKVEICKKWFNFRMGILILDHSGYVAASQA